MSTKLFRSAYDPSVPVRVSFPDQGRTKQSFKTECDINFIVDRAKRTGIVDHLNTKTPIFGDFTNVPSYQERLDSVIAVNAAFEQVPAKIRKLFNNDAGEFVAFAQDPANSDQLVKWGLAAKRPESPVEEAPAPGQTRIPGTGKKGAEAPDSDV